ncbi:MAG: ATP-binding protein [Terriglobus roseus]|nr:ATP-binding protein [Terriglobus roseus]
MAYSADGNGASDRSLSFSQPATPRRTRLSLGRSPRRLSYERRIRFWLLAFLAVPVALLTYLVIRSSSGALVPSFVAVLSACTFLLLGSTFYGQIIRPLQTLANIVVALREEDFSLRARGARRGDALGDLALELNLLAGALQKQRADAQDAVTLAERVITAMPSPVLAFDQQGTLRFLNKAAEQFLRPSTGSSRQTADQLGIQNLLTIPDGGIFTATNPLNDLGESRSPLPTRWSVRRTSFRLAGIPHTLLVLTDIAAALREEERVAWQRLIRVLGHEINNSLAPISSIAGSLRSRLPSLSLGKASDLDRGLGVIEDRAGALHRFLLAYQRLSRLPSPALQHVALAPLLERVAQLETRLPVQLLQSSPVALSADPDQLQQLLINLVCNAVDAALQHHSTDSNLAEVELSWRLTAAEVVVRVRDNGPGLANPRNLFVPFYTTKPQGSGIGLVLAQQIATAHGGSITLSSRTDHHGCDAEIYLPLDGVQA